MESFYKNIIPLLQEYFFGDYGKMRLVLGDGFIQFDEPFAKLINQGMILGKSAIAYMGPDQKMYSLDMLPAEKEGFREVRILIDLLNDDDIVEITEKGVRLRKGGEIELDMLILATGYDGLTGALLNFDVVGRDGRTVKDKWKDGARSHLGLMMEGFPNLFMTTGPNGPAALANIIRISEHDVDWIAAAMTHTGLDRRIALVTLTRVGTSTRGILLGAIAVTILLSLVVPSATARRRS